MKWPRRLLELLENWRHLIRRDGWKLALPRIGAEIATLPYRYIPFVVVTRSLVDPLPDLHAKVALEIRMFERADLDFVRRENIPSEANLCARRLERGHYGLVACLEGNGCSASTAVGYAWASTDLSLEKVDFELAPGDVLVTDAFTAPAYRGQGVQTALSLARLRLLRDQGYERALAYIETGNDASLAVWRKMGAQVTARLDFVRIGFWRRTRYY